MRKADIIFDAITNIKEDLIDAALDYRFPQKRIHWQRYMSMAACLALVVTVGFAATRLGISGGSSKSDCGGNMTTDSAAPEAENQKGSASEESAIEDSATNSTTTDSDSTEDYKSEPLESVIFGATVLEVSDTWILVEPLEGEEILASADRFLVSITDVEELPKLKKGCEVVIFFDGFIRESYPAQITATQIKPLLRELGKN